MASSYGAAPGGFYTRRFTMRDNNAIQIISFALAAVKWIPLYIAAIIVTLKVAVAVEKPKCDKERDKVALFAIFWPVCVPAYIV